MAMPDVARERFGFESFKLIPNERLLLTDEQPVQGLSVRDFDVLWALVDKAPDVVSKEDLIKRVWGRNASVPDDYLTGSIYNIREVLSLGNKSRKRAFIRTLPTIGYQFIASVTRHSASNSVPTRLDKSSEQQVPAASQNNSARIRVPPVEYSEGFFSKLNTLHTHVDGKQEEGLVDHLVWKFKYAGTDSKKSDVAEFEPGPQRKQDAFKALYEGHTPGLKAEELDYFSTHLFGNFASTKRHLKELLQELNRTEGIVIEAERIIQKIGETPNEHERSNIWIHEYPMLTSSDVGYLQWNTGWKTDLIEIHYACDIARDKEWVDESPLTCAQLVELSSRAGIEVGGWFRFDKPGFWAYRSNMFAAELPDVVRDRENLKREVSAIGRERGFDCDVRALVEQTLGVWKTPLTECDETKSVLELSDWEGKYPGLRDFWVVTPNFLGDRDADIQDAMVRNLDRDRGVTYTYFLRSVADYMRLRSFAERLTRRLRGRMNLNEKIRAVMVLREGSDKGSLREVFDDGGCFIANPIPPIGNDEVDDADGYALVMSEDHPGQISGGRLMEPGKLQRVIDLLTPLIPDGRSLQGLHMSLLHSSIEQVVPTPTIVCLGLENIGDLMSQVANKTVANQLNEYDLLVASDVSKLGGYVVRSIESGYLVSFLDPSAAILCAEQILADVLKDFAGELRQKAAVDRGDVWRALRANGSEYCGPTVTRCRELLKHTSAGEITTTVSFAEALRVANRNLWSRLVPSTRKAVDGSQLDIRLFKIASS